jgi:hypothetical protein
MVCVGGRGLSRVARAQHSGQIHLPVTKNIPPSARRGHHGTKRGSASERSFCQRAARKTPPREPRGDGWRGFSCPEHRPIRPRFPNGPSGKTPHNRRGYRAPPFSSPPAGVSVRGVPTIRGGHHVANAHGFRRRQPWRLSRVHFRQHPPCRRRRRPRCPMSIIEPLQVC